MCTLTKIEAVEAECMYVHVLSHVLLYIHIDFIASDVRVLRLKILVYVLLCN